MVVHAQNRVGNRAARDAVEAVAAGDEVALEPLVAARDPVAELGPLAVDPVQAHVLGLEHELAAAREPEPDQVRDQLLLRVHDHVSPAVELRVRNAVAATGEAQLDPAVDLALRAQALGQAALLEQRDRAVLEQPGAHPLLDVGAALLLEHHALDAPVGEQVREHQTRRPGTDDPDARARHHCR